MSTIEGLHCTQLLTEPGPNAMMEKFKTGMNPAKNPLLYSADELLEMLQLCGAEKTVGGLRVASQLSKNRSPNGQLLIP